LLGAFRSGPVLAAVATSGVILGATYLLWMYKRVMFGPIDNAENTKLTDLSGREISVLAPLVAVIVVMGVYPGPFLRTMDASVDHLVTQVRTAQAAAAVGSDRSAMTLHGSSWASLEDRVDCDDHGSPWTSLCRGVAAETALDAPMPAGARP
jgi:hypothetical protein